MSAFQSTRPVRGATHWKPLSVDGRNISIHAPRAGRDNAAVSPSTVHCNFNPRAPCGARPLTGYNVFYQPTFQSTRPVRGATVAYNAVNFGLSISIHAPRAGRDSGPLPFRPTRCNFNPRAPCGARQQLFYLRLRVAIFQSTRPVRGATRVFDAIGRAAYISIHAPRAGRDRFNSRQTNGQLQISIHAPRAGRDAERSTR